ncbi:hypothetical protein DK389_06680 [Methylobacterium durans]|uniref:DUF6894 domain-containing protein n=1 Tax=Methylobacterium durans TaxID=2202825 RepID=A0A2U8WGK0_9HYPH|nr:hypothetical protein DK389_06680 [Methylobacterium durans]
MKTPRYFIDLHDGSGLLRDDEGFELPDEEAARGKLTSILGRVAREFLPDTDQQVFTAAVRDQTGKVILRARLSLEVERTN